MSNASVAPGKRSLEALGWLARVGASPFEPLQLVAGCNRARTHDHIHRLVDAGLVRRVPMTRGDGSLVVVTPTAAVMAGYPACRAPRSVAPTTWAHTSACAWVSAWLHLRRHTWYSEREIALDDFWRHEVRYKDARGTARVTHRPDLGVHISRGLVAVEVELQRKSATRLRGVCEMYAQLTDTDGPLASVIYVTDRPDVAAVVKRIAEDIRLTDPTLTFRTIDLVMEQTRAAAHARAAATRKQTGAPR